MLIDKWSCFQPQEKRMMSNTQPFGSCPWQLRSKKEVSEMHPENVKALRHPIIGNVQVQRHPQIANILNNLQLSANSPGQHQVLTPSSKNEFSSFYVSFRLASVLPSPHSWGAYIAQSDIRSIEQKLVANGCSSTDSHRIAEETIYSMLAFQFLFDCELLNLHEIFNIAGLGLQADFALDAIIGESHTTSIIGMSFAGEKLRNEFGFNSTQATAIEANLPCFYKRGKFAAFSRQIFGYMLTNKISFSSRFALDQFLKTIPIYTSPDRTFPGVTLPTTRF